ncbi:MAG: hypothetical protein RIR26_913 [Pseudomonadota bacterium]|jgi:hypothetical protein
MTTSLTSKFCSLALVFILPELAVHAALASTSLEEELFNGGASTSPSPSAAPTNLTPLSPTPAGAIPATTTASSEMRETLTLGGRLELQYSVNKRSNDKVGDAAFSQSTGAELFLDSRPNDDLRGFVKGALVQSKTSSNSANTSNPTLSLYEMWVKWSNGGSVFTTLGKQKLKWGAASFWNPTDFLAMENKDPFASFDVRPGAHLLKVHVPFEKQGHNLYALVDFENAASVKSPRLAGRAEFNLNAGGLTGEMTTTIAGGKDLPLKLGVDFSAGVGPVDVIVESAFTRRSKQKFYQKSTAENGQIQFTTTDRSTQFIPQVVTGLRYDLKYSDSDAANLSVEYFWNDAGYSNVSLEAYSFAQGQSKTLYLARRYVGASAALLQPGSFNDSTVVLSGLSNLTDRSWLARTSFIQKISTRSRLEVAFSKVGGLGEFTGGIPSGIADEIKRSKSLPAGVGEALDRITGNGTDWTASVSAGVDL